MIKLYDRVALLEDLPDKNLVRGQIGMVTKICAPDALEVEFVDLKTAITYAILVLHPDQLMSLGHSPVDNTDTDNS